MVNVTVMPRDIAIELGRDPDSLSTLESAQWNVWILDAMRIVESGIGDLQPRQEDVDYVIRQAVLELARVPNPSVESDTVRIDDGQVTTRYRNSPRRITILPEWWALLGVKGGSAFSIDMAGDRTAAHQPWCDVHMGGAGCSCGASLAGFPLWEW